jgi:hypothetical protein
MYCVGSVVSSSRSAYYRILPHMFPNATTILRLEIDLTRSLPRICVIHFYGSDFIVSNGLH